ncbi:MAG: sigma-54-dependent Fis family transcriptional regulator [Planctomycetota bacterium]|nr:MAG: sigma-54-dependent Fis family transcriptional regulator [Planctomycetota bacterium]
MSETAFILIIDNQDEESEKLVQILRQQGHACRIVHTGEDALESIPTRRPDVIMVDAKISTTSKTDFLQQAKRLAPDAETILTGTDDDQQLLRDKKIPPGNIQFFKSLTKLVNRDQITKAVAEAAEKAKLNREHRLLQQQAERRLEFEGIVTGNEQIIRMFKRLKRIADSKLTVLILGESGTGKELVARAIHQNSPRKNNPYRAINCAGLNENLLESELFGHVKGAFTGATSDRKGLFEVVDSGSLFLDEVGDMPLAMQAKLLRTLENGEILPVGGNDIRQVDVRVIAATRRDIRSMVEETEFRDDLFYRLNQAMIRIPPLRERREDIPLLIEHFLKQASQLHEKSVDSISPEAVRRLTAHQWPGNARELRSVIDQMVVLADKNQLDIEDLPEHLRGTTDIVLASVPNTAGLTMEQMEKIHIANTLKLTGGNREKTAKMLGIGARTLYRKLREYGL